MACQIFTTPVTAGTVQPKHGIRHRLQANSDDGVDFFLGIRRLRHQDDRAPTPMDFEEVCQILCRHVYKCPNGKPMTTKKARELIGWWFLFCQRRYHLHSLGLLRSRIQRSKKVFLREGTLREVEHYDTRTHLRCRQLIDALTRLAAMDTNSRFTLVPQHCLILQCLTCARPSDYFSRSDDPLAGILFEDLVLVSSERGLRGARLGFMVI